MPPTPPASPPSVAPLAEAVLSRCDELAACSEEPTCLTRRYLTPPMRRVHALLGGWMREAGLATRVDNAGNLIGRRAAARESNNGASPRVLLLGSHVDTVPDAGRYDGVLGVLMSLAVCEALRDEPLPLHLDVIGLSEEEGVRFSKPYLGSAALAGKFQQEWLGRVDADGVTLAQAIADFRLDPHAIAACRYEPQDVLGFVEPHLEQGPVLERAGIPVGVVSGIAGQSRLRLAFRGVAAHAGTTPMNARSDALLCAAAFVTVVRAHAVATPGLRATVGSVRVLPNAPNVVPGMVELSLDVRHCDDAVRDASVAHLIEQAEQLSAAEGAAVEVLENAPQPAVRVDAPLTAMLTDAISACGHEPLPVLSGAGHDAVAMAQAFPVAMLFVRHPGAVSHCPDERVDAADVAVGIEVLARFVLDLANKVRNQA